MGDTQTASAINDDVTTFTFDGGQWDKPDPLYKATGRLFDVYLTSTHEIVLVPLSSLGQSILKQWGGCATQIITAFAGADITHGKGMIETRIKFTERPTLHPGGDDPSFRARILSEDQYAKALAAISERAPATPRKPRSSKRRNR